MMGSNLVEVEIAARLLEAGHPLQAYGVAVGVLHRVSNHLDEDARLCWDRARAVAQAAQVGRPRAA